MVGQLHAPALLTPDRKLDESKLDLDPLKNRKVSALLQGLQLNPEVCPAQRLFSLYRRVNLLSRGGNGA
jgi:hypothetical protein